MERNIDSLKTSGANGADGDDADESLPTAANTNLETILLTDVSERRTV
jgi:hypothetical protein